VECSIRTSYEPGVEVKLELNNLAFLDRNVTKKITAASKSRAVNSFFEK
jgi:hypothetical protein